MIGTLYITSRYNTLFLKEVQNEENMNKKVCDSDVLKSICAVYLSILIKEMA